MNGIPLNIDFQQILLHLLNVVILFFIIYFLLYKPVKNFMDKRKKEYEEMDSSAASRLKEAEDLKNSYEARLKDADDEIKALKSRAADDMAAQAAQSEQQAREQAEQILEKARTKAEQESSRILANTREEITELAKEAVSKALFDSPSDAYDSFLEHCREEKNAEVTDEQNGYKKE